MSKTLVIAEKPSVAQDIVRALTPQAGKFEKHAEHFENERYVVTSAIGHLVEIKAPEEFDVKRGKWSFAHLPVIPPHFDLAPIDKARRGSTRRQARQAQGRHRAHQRLRRGREGELIFRLIVQYAGLEKKGHAKPIRRLWLQSMTPQAIRDGFDRLRSDEEMLGLSHAARSRSEADWLVGINGTRAMTAFNSRDGGFFLTTVGRVQTPTLSIVVEREEKIRKHVPRDYWEIKGTFAAEAGLYEGKWFDPKFRKDETDPSGVPTACGTRTTRRPCAGGARRTGTVSEEAKPSSQSSPLLYDLTSLQREANSALRLLGQDDAVDRAGAVREAQGAHLPADRLARLPEDYVAWSRTR
jgi:DNA topoisomerase-3